MYFFVLSVQNALYRIFETYFALHYAEEIPANASVNNTFLAAQSAPAISIASFHLFPIKAAKYSSREQFQIALAIQNTL